MIAAGRSDVAVARESFENSLVGKKVRLDGPGALYT